jgi:hypothetical protein
LVAYDPATGGVSEELERKRDAQLTLTKLREEFEQERAARLALGDELSELRQHLSEIRTHSDRNPTETAPQATSETNKNGDLESEFAEFWFDEQALYDEGLGVSEVNRLHQRFDEVELEKLAARDRAARDGWSSSSRLSQELRDIQTRFRKELGDEDYDKILYAAGLRNRVRVDDLLRGSVASDSGIMVGDEIYSYAGERIFNPSSLYILTTQGEADEIVEIVILRDGDLYLVTAQRGPLGTKLGHTRKSPEG